MIVSFVIQTTELDVPFICLVMDMHIFSSPLMELDIPFICLVMDVHILSIHGYSILEPYHIIILTFILTKFSC